ncbi:hypothetical protein BOTBODRAFT_47848 [Botryobasidium botryosum FD-172 SS1]|uniref:Uncharacterized protein n=1 Tax=Botryobasidium botryosum (strain FD-172 SS1) TaxID=930990 RepID=A0A067MAV7_BOTB1|nr:hypothetical protein BOTBODRAFT_47848 [Botryobasidium botryosum FD-172 SS1]
MATTPNKEDKRRKGCREHGGIINNESLRSSTLVGGRKVEIDESVSYGALLNVVSDSARRSTSMSIRGYNQPPGRNSGERNSSAPMSLPHGPEPLFHSDGCVTVSPPKLYIKKNIENIIGRSQHRAELDDMPIASETATWKDAYHEIIGIP